MRGAYWTSCLALAGFDRSVISEKPGTQPENQSNCEGVLEDERPNLISWLLVQ